MAIQEGSAKQINDHGRDIVREYHDAARKNGGKLVFEPSPEQAKLLIQSEGTIPSTLKSRMEGGLPSDHE